jgi:capsule polysaccharide export protein KpsE/RkpR
MTEEKIVKRMKIISDMQDELNKIKALMEETLENDPKYQEIQAEENKVKEETKVKRDKVMANSTVQNFQDQMKKIREDIKEHRETLAQELADYYKESGSLEIEDDEGNTKRIVFSVKLVNS